MPVIASDLAILSTRPPCHFGNFNFPYEDLCVAGVAALPGYISAQPLFSSFHATTFSKRPLSLLDIVFSSGAKTPPFRTRLGFFFRPGLLLRRVDLRRSFSFQVNGAFRLSPHLMSVLNSGSPPSLIHPLCAQSLSSPRRITLFSKETTACWRFFHPLPRLFSAIIRWRLLTLLPLCRHSSKKYCRGSLSFKVLVPFNSQIPPPHFEAVSMAARIRLTCCCSLRRR